MKVETTSEEILFAPLRIETPSGVGTGSIVAHDWADDKEGAFLVTNRHVVEGTRKGRLNFILADQSSTWAPALGQSTHIDLSEKLWSWTNHPSADVDIAVLPLGGVLNHLNGIGSRPYYRSIPTAMIPELDVLEDLDVVEEVLFVGYPNGIYDRANNLPIFRKGTTATPLSVDYDGKPTFLIDASVFPGSSGSPVFIYKRGSWITRKRELQSGQRIYFIGVLGSVYYREDDGSLNFQEIPTAVGPIIKTRQMIDLGIVYKARTVVEVIEHWLREHGELPAISTTVGNA